MTRAPAKKVGRSFLVVAVGASSGGLDAFRKLLDALPADQGMAFILVQHLDPNHASLLAELLGGHTTMTVEQAADGMMIEEDHVYLIPPGAYLSVADGALRLSPPNANKGARLPFDFLLRSLAKEIGSRAVCVVLSGAGADGSLALSAVKEAGGAVIVQDPEEAGFNGMPRSAIATGLADHILVISRMPAALRALKRRDADRPLPAAALHSEPKDGLQPIIRLLRDRTPHDFSAYKPGTLRRRIARRQALLNIASQDDEAYLKVLRADSEELASLSSDLLINVTDFFRDPEVFDHLAKTIIPDMIARQPPEQALRIWTVGCSTGEETYSLAILFREQILSANRNIQLQIFASDVDADVVATAREGVYPSSIRNSVSTARLARFFSREDDRYRVAPDLRACVVFTVQNILTDPPFSRLDLISCRNLLIYLRPEAQNRVASLFHFALRDGGLLLLGATETVGDVEGRFDVVSKPARLYRHRSGRRVGDVGLLASSKEARGLSVSRLNGISSAVPTREVGLADLCRRLVIEAHAPASVLINGRNECLFSLGPVDRYMRLAAGQPTHDVIAMARPPFRVKLRATIDQARLGGGRAVAAGGRVERLGASNQVSIEIQPVPSSEGDLLLICFVDKPDPPQPSRGSSRVPDAPRVGELEHELETLRVELQAATRSLELSIEDQAAMTEEALSVSEEHQSTNEELQTSKEELQSLNEELTALNGQLQESLERQKTTATDLQNILYSTDVATLFLDPKLNIRFFTPATKSLFNVIPTDIGRPLDDLNSLATDTALLSDAREMLRTLKSSEREVETRDGHWYVRRILPYRASDNQVEGVVITFSDITDRKRASDALGEAKRQAEMANVAKSRFLAAASHDLRQPLQTLSLLQGLLSRGVKDASAKTLVARFDQTLGAMSGMLNALLDINQIEAGTLRADITRFPIDTILDRLKDEFAYHAAAQHLDLRVAPCRLNVESDSRLLEQMLRNLVSNALKYTTAGRVLIGCRRHGTTLAIEVWDTGAGIPDEALQTIFEEYHQLDNAARERSRGLGLGLSIVQRLATLLDQPVRVRSRLGVGSVFSIDVPVSRRKDDPKQAQQATHERAAATGRQSGSILVIEDDPDARDLLVMLLQEEGHHATAAADAKAALSVVSVGPVEVDLIVADYNLPGGMNGVELTTKLRGIFPGDIPVVILTGDISIETLREIGQGDCVQLNKPVHAQELADLVQTLLTNNKSKAKSTPLERKINPAETASAVIYVVDDDSNVLGAIVGVLEAEGRRVEAYADSEAFLAAFHPGGDACLLVDAYLPGLGGLDLLRRLRREKHAIPTIVITGSSDVPMAVEAMKAGASDFIEKPVGRDDLLQSVERALATSHAAVEVSAWRQSAVDRLGSLTPRQTEIMGMVLAGRPSKNIAFDLGISQRTVENHRASIMHKTGSSSLPGLARLALAAAPRADADAALV